MGNAHRSTTKQRKTFITEQKRDFVRNAEGLKQMKNDRRSRRTRQLLGDALVELMLEKRFENITVQEILDRADVGRSTFYAHYTDKESLLASQIERMIHELGRYTTETHNIHRGLLPSLELFRHVQQQRRLMQAFVWGSGGENHIRGLKRQVCEFIEQNLCSMSGSEKASSVPLPVLANFVASTFLMLLVWWFEDGMTHTPEQMDEMFQKLVIPAVDQWIEQE
jgi:AcrR family transcriptional regulator